MATTVGRCWRRVVFLRNFLSQRGYHTTVKQINRLPWLTACGCATGVAAGVFMFKNFRQNDASCHIVEAAKEERTEKKQAIQTQRELRFLNFASVEYDGHVYMTPQDFLESVTAEVPRPRAGRRTLNRDDIDRFQRDTPTRGYGSTKLFRNLHDKGLISYTEYLFLVCVLTKPKSGFKIAFNMFDTDGNQRVDRKEFLVLERVMTEVRQKDGHNEGLLEMYEAMHLFGRKSIQETDRVRYQERGNLWRKLRELEELFASPSASSSAQKSDDIVTGAPMADTTLVVHFFGRKGKDVLKYEDFHRFMDNLQSEVLELEYNEFSRGMPTITEEHFARILLRYTVLSREDRGDYLNRLREKIPHSKGISFQEFKDFCQFLNNLDDFALAMRMFTFTNQPISQEDFARSVKATTGQSLSAHVVNVVFQLFDTDGDGHLSQKEFISVMKDRLYRGFRATLMQQGRWDIFKSCVKTELRSK